MSESGLYVGMSESSEELLSLEELEDEELLSELELNDLSHSP